MSRQLEIIRRANIPANVKLAELMTCCKNISPKVFCNRFNDYAELFNKKIFLENGNTHIRKVITDFLPAEYLIAYDTFITEYLQMKLVKNPYDLAKAKEDNAN